MFSKFARASLLALAATAATASFAEARTPYDGRWSLTIHTTRGDCSTYNFPVDITNGQVSVPNLVRANGRVTPKGSVRVFVAAMGKAQRIVRLGPLERQVRRGPLLRRVDRAAGVRLAANTPHQTKPGAGSTCAGPV
jgi:hypothetical protein